MSPSHRTFSAAEAADRRALVSTVRWRAAVALFHGCALGWWAQQATAGELTLNAPWATWVVLALVGGSVAYLVGALRGIAACRLAPRRLLGTAGVRATVVYVGRATAGVVGSRVEVVTALGEKVALRVLAWRGVPLANDDAVTLYRRRGAAAFVTDTDTFWAVGGTGLGRPGPVR